MRQMRPLVIGVLLTTLVFAGCVSGEANDADKASESASATLDAGGDSAVGPVGSLRGTVRDDELQPIAGASVGLLKTSVPQITTDEAGAFAYENLPVGEYAVIAQKLGYEARSVKVNIAEGQTMWANLTLVALAAADEIHMDTSSHITTLQCMLVTPAWVSTCSWPYTAVYLTAHSNGVNLSNYGAPSDIFANKFRYNYSLEPEAKTVVSELQWKAQSEMAKKMFIKQCRPDYDPVEDYCPKEYGGSPTGGLESPISVHWDPKPVYKEKDFKNWVMSAVWPAFPGTSTNQGVYLEQKVEMWNTEFYGDVAPEGWSIFASQTGN